jgi:hypothetical protein
MLMQRAKIKKDSQTYRLTRAIKKMQDFYSCFEPMEWTEDPAWRNAAENLPDVPERDPFFCAAQSRRKLELLHTFNAVVPDELHPVLDGLQADAKTTPCRVGRAFPGATAPKRTHPTLGKVFLCLIQCVKLLYCLKKNRN